MKKLINKQHENFVKDNQLNDIALLKLTQDVVLNKNIQIACLPDPKHIYYPAKINISAWTTGWGYLKQSGTPSDSLQNVKLTVYDGNLCNNSVAFYTKNWRSQICAGELKGGKDSCQGDSGGSLYVQDTVNNKTKYISVGIGI